MSANVDRKVAGQKGIFTFRVGGALHHMIGSSLPLDDQPPSFSQIYLMGDGGTEEASMRQHYHNNELNPIVLGTLQTLLNSINPYAILFKNSRTVLQQNPHSTIVLRSLKRGNRHDFKRYNQPAPHDVGAVMQGDGTFDLEPREILLHRQSGGLLRITELNTNYLAIRYPILFPRGGQGWDEFYVSPTRTKPISQRALNSTGKNLD